MKKWKGGVLKRDIELNGEIVSLQAEKRGEAGDAHEILFSWNNSRYTFSEILDTLGDIPIPPYLNRKSEEGDLMRYQTVYSKIKGSVAAPTAGLHFTDKIFYGLKEKRISVAELTLHVGAGTFKPVKSDTIGGHGMHAEHIAIGKGLIKKLLAHQKKIIAVGTTSVRTLESLYWIGTKIVETPEMLPHELVVQQWEPYNRSTVPTTKESLSAIAGYMERNNLEILNSSTQIIIVPGYDFKVVNGMFTNFHQPQSTLLLLVSAFIGDDWKKVYNHALENDYRFLSYGDSNLYLR